MTSISSASSILDNLVSTLSASSAQLKKTTQQTPTANDLTAFATALQDAAAALTQSAQALSSTTTATPDKVGTVAGSTASATTSTSTTASTSTAASATDTGNIDYYDKLVHATLNPDYKAPDYIRMNFSVDWDKDRLNTFMNANPQYAADFLNVTSGGLSQYSTDGSSQVKTDMSTLSADDQAYFKGHVAELRVLEGLGLDPALTHHVNMGSASIPQGTDATAYLQSHKLNADGTIVASNNVQAYANAKPIGINGVGSVLADGQGGQLGNTATA
ncbi:MAG: hypothetical protein QM740_14765 [Acidovorax sp.]